MQFNVAQLLKEPTGATRSYELNEDLDRLDDELRFLGPLVGEMQLLRTNSGVLVTGELSAAVQVLCNRCLERIAQPVRFLLEEHFRPLTEVFTGRFILPEEFEGDTDELEDEALLINEQHILDISEVVRQAVWLALPMYPSCNWEGEGPCPNLLQLAETADERVEFLEISESIGISEQDEIDPRWESLRKLREQAGDENEK